MTKWARLGRSLGAPNWRNLGLEPWILNLAKRFWALRPDNGPLGARASAENRPPPGVGLPVHPPRDQGKLPRDGFSPTTESFTGIVPILTARRRTTRKWHSLAPIAGVPFCVCNRHDEHAVVHHSIDDTKREVNAKHPAP